MLKRKDKGILDQFLPAIVVIVLLAVLWTGSMIIASNIDRKNPGNGQEKSTLQYGAV